MDWLTDDGTRAWARDAFRETKDGEWPDVNTIADCVIDEVARAAARNLVEWMTEHNAAPLFESKRMTVTPSDMLIVAVNLASLKAAVEGE